MSVRVSAEPCMMAIPFARSSSLTAGTISASGFPCPVTRIGLRVLRTRSSSATQFALNSENVHFSHADPYCTSRETVKNRSFC